MQRTSVFSLKTRDDIEKIAAAVAVHAPFALPIYRAAGDGLINLVQPERGAQVRLKMLERSNRPVLVLIGDDDYQSSGPAGWACALRVRRWGEAAMVHASGGEVRHYEAAVASTLICGRLLLVETSADQHAAWKNFLDPKMPTLSIIARDGVHPAPPGPEAVN